MSATSISDPDRAVIRHLFFLLYLGVTLTLVFHHEAWRDEADPWLYVRDADLGTILQRSAYAGFPAGWFLVLTPLAKSGLPYFSQNLLHWAIGALTAWLILYRAPLRIPARVLIVFSYYFSFEYIVVARSYALSILLLILAASAFRTRFDRPFRVMIPLALAANVNAHSFLIAFCLAAVVAWDSLTERKSSTRLLASLAVFVAAALVSVLQVIRPDDAAPVMRQTLWWRFDNFLDGLAESVAPTLFAGNHAALLLLVAAGFATITALTSRPARIFLLTASGSLLALFLFVYAAGPRHYGFLFVVSIIAFWIDHHARDSGTKRRRTQTLVIAAYLTISAAAALNVWIMEIRQPYSGAEEMGRYVRRHELDRFPIAGHSPFTTAAVLPYLHDGKKLWFAGLGDYGSFMTWDLRYEKSLRVTYPDAVARTRQAFRCQPHLLLLNVSIPDPAAEKYELVYSTEAMPFARADERFWLYRPIECN